MNEPIQVVLLPGLHGNGDLFAPFIATAPAWAEPRAVNYPPTLAEDYREISRFAARSIDFSRPFVLVGESFSGPVALQIAAEQPQQLRGVVLSGSFVTNPRPLPALFCSPERARKLLSLPLPASVVRWLLLGNSADAALPAQVKAAVAAVGPEVLAARLEMIVHADFRAELAQCTVPILYLRAVQDRVVAEKSLREIVCIAPQTQVVNIASGHFMLQTCPQQCWDAITQWRRNLK
ncbi:MAG: alpha/beta fold hydrolase [Gammaproteobacteria bacterium]